eukprot:CAMPEP_0177417392 /NCGR_PEP_ID=MMETSP0368-20130122/68620_1 /TAXON_ID=447022 ORGANISM="Scrippsiella hangoei-like, Strain SHHI-4" /NCGR_SAMPLE_ID=MMETSP0368 /ASSEMBLY_ACC=CAM_ASM_000363 /LENGTH=282 /DNA_ID=CAMNT_0018886959 /DNA_START=8 /DNA_END=853 /DNA_ORIENTATION=-
MAARFGAGALASHRALLHDIRPGVAAALAARHPQTASVATSLQQLARESDIVLFSLPHGQAVQSCVAAIVDHLREGSLVVDTSTTGPEVARAAAAALAARGVCFLDAPVTGAPARAAAGTLTVMAGGDEARLVEVRPVLGTFAELVVHMGAVGNGQIAKAMNNCLYNVGCAAMAEMLPLAKRAGLPLDAFSEVVSTGTGQSFAFNQWAPHVLRREFEAPKFGYPMGEAFKDLETLGAVADELGVELPPVVTAARGTYRRALEMGLQDEHKGAMVKVWERELG